MVSTKCIGLKSTVTAETGKSSFANVLERRTFNVCCVIISL